jgi:aldehyde dehydrogenase (NAD+)
LLSGTERGKLMAKLADLIEAKKELLASTEAWDNGELANIFVCGPFSFRNLGKPYAVALEEDLPETFNTIRYYSGWADKLHGQVIGGIPGKFAYTIRQPIGVVAQIIPWNYPLSMAAWKLGPALACGNTVVLKPAEQTPVSILLLAELIKEAGFPPGVVNIVNGLGREAGSALVQHPDVDKVAFTGSTATAREIMKMAAGTLKNITLETGGKSPLLVFNDADLEEAVKWSHIGIMSNQGQICTSTSRVLVQDDIYDKFVAAFVAHTKNTSVVGDPFNKDTFQGPQVTKSQYDKILSYVKIGKSEGATLATGGEAHRGDGGKGFYIQPTIFTNVKEDMKVYREEIFGPVVVVTKFSDEDDAIRRANDTTYGLGAAVFTRDIEKAHRVAAEIQAGMVWVNSSQDSDYRVPFGGVKQSGIGRELGEAGLKEYSQVKAIHVNMTSRECKL